MKRKKSSLFDSGIIKMWMTSFFILILFITVSVFLSYSSAEKKIKKELEQMNEAFMNERIVYIDRYVNNIAVGLLNISRLSNFDKISLIGSQPGSDRRYELYEFDKNMNSIEIEGAITEQRFVYIPENNLIIGNGTMRTPQEYFNVLNQKGGYDNWQQNVLDKKAGDMLYYDTDNDLLYFKTWYTPSNNKIPEAMIAIAINKSEFTQNIKITPGVDFVICGTDGKQIMSISGDDYSDIISQSEFMSSIVTTTKKNYVVSTEKGVGVDWNYMCVSNSERYMRMFRAAKLILICCFILVMFLSMLMGYYFTRKNNRIIFKLSSILKTDKNTKDEYAAIYQSVNEIIADANQKSAIIYKQQKNQRNSLMKDLLAKDALPEKTDNDLKQADINFEHRYFCVAEVEAVQYSKIFFEENDDLTEARQFANYIIANVYNDLFNAAVKCYPTEIGNRVALIINCTDQFLKDKKELNKILEFGAAFIEENFNVKLKITISAIVDGKENIHKCYESILWSKDYRTMKNDIIFDVDEFEKDGISQQCYYYPVKDEQLLAADIKRGVYEKVEEEINRIFDINIKKNIAPKFMKILASNIIGLIIRVIDPQETGANDIFALVNEAYNSVEHNESIEEIRKKLCSLSKAVCEFINNDAQKNKRSMVDEIKKYICEHYEDPQLNANYVADWFNVKSSFISTLFKKQEGMGLLEYITLTRIEAAKRLLRETDDIMSVIGEKVGFTSERTFFRVFEKYVGVSPGKFKRQMTDDNGAKPDEM